MVKLSVRVLQRDKTLKNVTVTVNDDMSITCADKKLRERIEGLKPLIYIDNDYVPDLPIAYANVIVKYVPLAQIESITPAEKYVPGRIY